MFFGNATLGKYQRVLALAFNNFISILFCDWCAVMQSMQQQSCDNKKNWLLHLDHPTSILALRCYFFVLFQN
jgi:hypothetical protein